MWPDKKKSVVRVYCPIPYIKATLNKSFRFKFLAEDRHWYRRFTKRASWMCSVVGGGGTWEFVREWKELITKSRKSLAPLSLPTSIQSSLAHVLYSWLDHLVYSNIYILCWIIFFQWILNVYNKDLFKQSCSVCTVQYLVKI